MTSAGKKRRLTLTAPDISEELAMEVQTSSAADVNAEFYRRLCTIMRVATTSSNLNAASYISAA
jgi:hypothetical protein